MSFPDRFADFVGSVPLTEVTLPWGETRVWDLGEGRPVVLVHGIAGSRRVFFRVASLLARNHRVVVPLLRGEDRPDPRASLADHHDDLAALLNALDLSQATLLGISFGGYVVLSYGGARRDPRVRDLAVQGSFSHYPLCAFDRIAMTLSPLMPDAFGSWYFARRVRKGPETDRLHEHCPGLEILNAEWCAKTPFASLRRRTRIIGRQPQDETIRRIAVPVTLGQGRADRVVPMECFERLRRTLPQARFVVWDGVSHLAPLTHPEEVAALVPE